MVNQKGGVGKTTTSVSLAAALGMEGKKVLLIDLDPQANATSGLGYDKKAAGGNIYRVLIGETGLEETIIRTPYRNLSLAPSHPDLTGAEVELISSWGREYKLRDALQPIKEKYPYIIIDCPPSLNILTINALAAATGLILPVQCEYYALEGISQLTGAIRLVKERLNPDLEVWGVLLTMCDSRTKLSLQVADEVKRYFKDKVYRTIIPRNVRLSEAPGFGKPIGYYDKDSSGAESYLSFTREVIDRVEVNCRNGSEETGGETAGQLASDSI